MLETPRDVIKMLGGIAVVAKLTGRDYYCTANWNRSARFPSNTFVALQAALRKKKLKASPKLWGM